MDEIRGYEKTDERLIPELDVTAYRYVHTSTGADILFLKNTDENKVFGITFRTPPKDGTGIPHILEHSVLCGSRKYPLKEPFVELLKGSLQTFLNAFTYPDKTCYPVASTHNKDFCHLSDVYLDAVFFPLLKEETFLQEGWHYHLEHPNDEPEIRGVVYNEMKGAYSSPERILAETVQRSLFPDHPYAFDSGGNPFDIPKLTYEDFLAYHKTFYHPSNARIFFYGNGPIHTELSWLTQYLKHFTAAPVNSDIPDVKHWSGFRSIRQAYAVVPGKELDKKTYATINWLLPETSDVFLNFSLQILHHILIGMPGSPLRKALVESGLGEDLVGDGLETELRWMYFYIGLKGMSSSRVDDMVNLIYETVNKLIRDGIPRSTVEAALNIVEFYYREGNTGAYPRGLILMLNALTTWLYGHNPLDIMAFDKPIKTIKDLFARNPHYFSELLEKYFVHNSRKTLVVLDPDPELMAKIEKKIQEQIEQAKQHWTSDTLQYYVEKTRALMLYQEQPDSPEDIAKIPRLDKHDLDPEPPHIPRYVDSIPGGALLVIHPQETHGIGYIDIGFRFNHISQAALPYLPLFCSSLLEAGTTEEDYVTFSERIARHTGGILPKIFVRSCFNEPSSGAFVLFLRGKALHRQIHDLVHIFKDMIHKLRLDQKERIFQILLRHKAIQYQRIIPEGHRMAMRRVRAHFNVADRVKEELSGISQYFFVKNLVDNFEEKWPTIMQSLYVIKEHLFRLPEMIVSITADDDVMPTARNVLEEDFFPTFSHVSSSSTEATYPWSFKPLQEKEAFALPVQVHYIASGAPISITPLPEDISTSAFNDGSFLVVLNYLRTTWLWEKIRVQGGAYGAHCFFDRASKLLVMTSYRDPHLAHTVDVIRTCSRYLEQINPDEEDIIRTIIGTFGKLDPPLFPDAKAYTSLARLLTGESEEMRRILRAKVIETSRADFKHAASVLERWASDSHLCALGPLSSLESAHSTVLTGAPIVTVET